MVAENRAYDGAGVFDSGAQISYRNDKKVNHILKVCLKWIRNLGEAEILVFLYEIMLSFNGSTIPFLIYVKKTSCTINMKTCYIDLSKRQEIKLVT